MYNPFLALNRMKQNMCMLLNGSLQSARQRGVRGTVRGVRGMRGMRGTQK